MTNKKLWFGMLVMVLVFGMAIIGCDDITKTGSHDDVTYTASANGSTFGFASTKIEFDFNAAVSGLTDGNITITAGTGAASKGTLTGSGKSWSLSITDVSAGTVKVKITKTGIESGEKTVTVFKGKVEDTANGSSKEQAILLSITQWKNGSVAKGEAKWYKFEATSETSYRVQWKDKNDKPASDSYTSWVKVTAYQSDGTTNISTINGANYGWEKPKTVSGVGGTVYLKVEPDSSSASYAGTYTIRFYDPAIVAPQIPMSISYANATPGSTVIVLWNSVSDGVSGYRVYRSDAKTGAYTQIGEDITSYLTAGYTDTTVSAGSSYWYKVAAYNGIGEGDKSDAKQSDRVPDADFGLLLTIGASFQTEGTLSMATQVFWYKFEAESGKTYKVQWADSWEKPDGSSYTAVLRVSAFESNGTPISGIQNNTFGWKTPKTVSGVSGTVYIRVAAYISSIDGEPYFGTYGIKVSQQ